MTPTQAKAPPLDIVALDDDPDFREYLRAVLEPEKHTLRTAAVPAEAFDAIESRLPDAVLLDMNMGDATGDAVLAEIRERWPKLCVIVVTGYPSLDSMRQTFKADVFDYLAKPFSTDDLHRVLAQASIQYGLGKTPHDRLRDELGRQIRVSRTKLGWTLKELSEHSGVSVSQLSSVERGAHLPSLESLTLIAEALNDRPSDWLRDAGF